MLLRADLDRMMIAKSEMETITDKYPELITLDVNSVALVGGEIQAGIAILPAYPAMLKIASLRGIENNTILLQTEPSNIPTTTCGDGYAANVKGACLLNGIYGIKSPISKCSSHLASGTIKRSCSSVNSSQEAAENLYDNLHSILMHFAMSPKSNQLLNNTLDALEMSNIHILNWGSARMGGFMDACSQASQIIVPFLDIIVTGGIRNEETKFVASPKGVYLLQLFTDLHPVFTKNYPHCVERDKILIGEVHNITQHTAEILRDPSIKKLLANSLYNNLRTDENQNVHALFNLKGSLQSITLNAKVGTRGNNLHKTKESLLRAKNEILECMAYNIASQNENGTLASLMSAFNLSSMEEYDSHAQKISQLFYLYGLDTDHEADEWYRFKVKLTLKKRLKCTKNELLEQFKKAFAKMNAMARQPKGNKKLAQVRTFKE